nr:LysR family transcriptional regulator [Escherichia coli]
MVFLEVARSGGIMNASKKLNITQPTVTRIIRELENYVGTPLFERTGNDSNLLIVFYVQIMPDDLVMQLHRF